MMEGMSPVHVLAMLSVLRKAVLWRGVFPEGTVLAAWLLAGGAAGMVFAGAADSGLPRSVGAWTLADGPQTIRPDAIFDYMDGAGEMYLGFRFDKLDVFNYKSNGGKDNILVELYSMKSPDDAFGLLSQDWGGEAVSLSPASKAGRVTVAPPARALYGAGLLRLCAGSLYARILAERESPAAKEAVLALGRAVVAGRGETPEPTLLNILPQALEERWVVRRDHIAFFRSPLVLNSLHYIGSENILDLGPEIQGVFAPYEAPGALGKPKRLFLVILCYPDAGRARRALDRFSKGVMPKSPSAGITGSPATHSSEFKTENGWTGYRLNGAYLALVFEAPDEASARAVLDHVRNPPLTKEVSHE